MEIAVLRDRMVGQAFRDLPVQKGKQVIPGNPGHRDLMVWMVRTDHLEKMVRRGK